MAVSRFWGDIKFGAESDLATMRFGGRARVWTKGGLKAEIKTWPGSRLLGVDERMHSTVLHPSPMN